MEWLIITAVIAIIFLPMFFKKKKNDEKAINKDDLKSLNPANHSNEQILREAKGKKRTLTFTNCHNHLFTSEEEKEVNKDFSYSDFIKVISEIEIEFIENNDVYESGISDDVFYAYEDFLSEKINYEIYKNDYIQKIKNWEEEAKLYINNEVDQNAIVKSIESEVLIPDFNNFTSGTDVIENFYEFKGFKISYKIEYSYKNADSEYIKRLISIKINYDIQQNMFGSSDEEIMNFNSKDEKKYLLEDFSDFTYSFTLPEKMVEINSFSIKYEKNKVIKTSKDSFGIKKDKSLNKERAKFLYLLKQKINLLPNSLNLRKHTETTYEFKENYKNDFSTNDNSKQSLASDDLFNDKMEIKIDGFEDKK